MRKQSLRDYMRLVVAKYEQGSITQTSETRKKSAYTRNGAQERLKSYVLRLVSPMHYSGSITDISQRSDWESTRAMFVLFYTIQ